MRRVCVVVTARASYARIRSVLANVRDHPDLELQLVVGASALLERYGPVVDIMRSQGFDPHATVYMVVEGENLVTMAKSTGLGLAELATAFDNLRPDVVVSVADRYETIATAIAASYLNIPVAHVQGGEVTGSIDEKVRHAVTKLANQHFVSTRRAGYWVRRMGEPEETIHLTGCPSIDIAAEIQAAPGLDFDPFERYPGVGPEFDVTSPFLVVMQHPVTTEHELARQHVEATWRAVREVGLPAFWFWPNSDAGSDGASKALRVAREVEPAAPVHLVKNMAPEDFLRLLSASTCIVGNSSVAIRECSYLGIPAVNIGTRQEGRERGPNVIDVGYEAEEIAATVTAHAAGGSYESSQLYGDGLAGRRIAELLATVPLTVEKRLTYSDPQ